MYTAKLIGALSALGLVTALGAPATAQEQPADGHSSFTTENGYTVDKRRQSYTNEDGDTFIASATAHRAEGQAANGTASDTNATFRTANARTGDDANVFKDCADSLLLFLRLSF